MTSVLRFLSQFGRKRLILSLARLLFAAALGLLPAICRDHGQDTERKSTNELGSYALLFSKRDLASPTLILKDFPRSENPAPANCANTGIPSNPLKQTSSACLFRAGSVLRKRIGCLAAQRFRMNGTLLSACIASRWRGELRVSLLVFPADRHGNIARTANPFTGCNSLPGTLNSASYLITMLLDAQAALPPIPRTIPPLPLKFRLRWKAESLAGSHFEHFMRDKSLFKSEADFIAWIRRRTPRRVAGLTLGIGDDAALVAVPPGQELILTTDMSIEGVHFTSTLHPPQAVGHRALARSLSDIAAMGGTPRYALISLAASRRTGRAWLEGFFDGLFALARTICHGRHWR